MPKRSSELKIRPHFAWSINIYSRIYATYVSVLYVYRYLFLLDGILKITRVHSQFQHRFYFFRPFEHFLPCMRSELLCQRFLNFLYYAPSIHPITRRVSEKCNFSSIQNYFTYSQGVLDFFYTNVCFSVFLRFSF